MSMRESFNLIDSKVESGVLLECLQGVFDEVEKKDCQDFIEICIRNSVDMCFEKSDSFEEFDKEMNSSLLLARLNEIISRSGLSVDSCLLSFAYIKSLFKHNSLYLYNKKCAEELSKKNSSVVSARNRGSL